MDRPLDPGLRRRAFIRRVSLALVGGALLVWGVVWLAGWIRPSLDRAQVRTARVEWGTVEAGITASGVVAPAFEQVVSSPITSRVVRVLERPGTQLQVGQPIVELDLSGARLAVEKLDEHLALKRNQQVQLGQEMERQLSGLEVQRRIKEMELQNIEEKTRQNRTLLEMGAVARSLVRQSELDEARAALELEKIEGDMEKIQASTRTRVEGLVLEMKILEKEREEAMRRLERARICADRDGVLTWVIDEEGAAVSQGAVVARIADLRAFRVEATIHAFHADRVHAGLPVEVVLQGEYLAGAVTHVLPEVQGSGLRLEVRLDQAGHPKLRPELRVDVRVILQRRDKALRIEKGPFIQGGEGMHDAFVVRGDRAVRVSARMGIAGFDYYEVVDGLEAGDEVVISDMQSYSHMKEVTIR